MALEITYSLLHNKVPKSALNEKSLALVCYIEGSLSIYQDSLLFFDEPMPLLELGAHLYRWLFLHGATTKFTYLSMEHDEPILVFTQMNEKLWVIDSIWRKCDPLHVTQQGLMSAIAQFLARLDRDLQAEYGLAIEAFSVRVPYLENE